MRGTVYIGRHQSPGFGARFAACTLKLEQHRDAHGSCARMTCKFAKQKENKNKKNKQKNSKVSAFLFGGGFIGTLLKRTK